jgi:hypothetical protein
MVAADYSFIGSGFSNSITGDWGVIGGGYDNSLAGGLINTIGGGRSNEIQGNAGYSFIGGGRGNVISASVNHGGILGGIDSLLKHSNSFIVGAGVTSSGEDTTFVRNLSYQGLDEGSAAILSNGESSGEIVFWGGGTTVAGQIFYLGNDAGSPSWKKANASGSDDSRNMLAIALGTSPSDGMLLRGYYRSTTLPISVTGEELYLATGSIGIQNNSPSTSGHYVRIIGYTVSATNDMIYFTPDNTWVEIA